MEAIEPFLLRLFRDPDIIDFPFAKIAREPLARIISSNSCEESSQPLCRRLAGKSPILESHARSQARALEDRVGAIGRRPGVFVAMRYWHPLTEEAVACRRSLFGPDELVLLPLSTIFQNDNRKQPE